MATGFLSPIGGAGWQFFTDQGVILSGGLLSTYLAGTTTPAATYTTPSLTTQNPNPIVLNEEGRPPNEIWFTQGTQYKITLTDSNSVLLTPGTFDNLSGINDVTSSSSASEWIATNLVPTYISATSFSVPGNQTAIFTVNRRVQASVTAGTVYGTVISSVYNGSSLTTVTLVFASGQLDSGLSAVYYGFTNPTYPSYTSLVNIQVFSSSGTYTPSNGTIAIIVEMVGGGGSGGGAPATGSGQGSCGAAGGAGGYIKFRSTSGFTGATVTIGAGGVGASGSQGTFGGATSMLGYTAGGGSAGTISGPATTASTAPAGGGTVGGSGQQLIVAFSGGPGSGSFIGPDGFLDGVGGGTPLGSGSSQGGGTPNGYGGGGTGSLNPQSSSAQVGTNGAAGVVIIYEYA
jgi:hypothetical protein